MHTVALAYRGITIVPNPPRPAYQIMRVGLKPGGPDRPYARERERDSAFTLLQSPIKHWGALVAEGSRTPLMPCRRRRERLRVWDRPRFGDVGMCGEVRQVPVGEGGELRKVRFGCGVEARIGVERRHLHTHTYIHTHTQRHMSMPMDICTASCRASPEAPTCTRLQEEHLDEQSDCEAEDQDPTR